MMHSRSLCGSLRPCPVVDVYEQVFGPRKAQNDYHLAVSLPLWYRDQ